MVNDVLESVGPSQPTFSAALIEINSNKSLGSSDKLPTNFRQTKKESPKKKSKPEKVNQLFYLMLDYSIA